LDANILVRAVLGRLVKSIRETYAAREFQAHNQESWLQPTSTQAFSNRLPQ
jgi:hypothetical protein